jgi:hypothetical protein
MKQLKLTLLIVVSLNLQTIAYDILPKNSAAVCPGEWITYSIDPDVGEVLFFYWTVTNGEILNGTSSGTNKYQLTTGSSSISVKWSDVGEGTIHVLADKFIGYDPEITRTYKIKSIKDSIPELLDLTSPTQVGIQTLSLRPRCYYPRGLEDDDPFKVEKYNITIPAGWSSGGTVSTGSNIYVYTVTSTYFTVTTDNYSEGNITVKAINNCSDGNDSQILTTAITRYIPDYDITLFSNNTYVDGDNSIITATAPAYTGATYQWSVSTDWSYTGSGNSISVSPNGCTGSINCTIIMGNTTKSKFKQVPFNVFDPLDPPVVSGDDVICSTNEIFTCLNLPANSTVSWAKSSNIIGGSAGASTTFRQNGSMSGEGWINAIITSTCSAKDTIEVNDLWVGEPDPDDFWIEVLDIYGNGMDDGSGVVEICEDESYSFYLYPLYTLPSSHHKYGIIQTNFYPDFNYSTWLSSLGYAYLSVDYFNTESSGILNLNAKCNNDLDFIEMVFVEGDCGGYYMMLSPNPTSGETSVSIETTSTKVTIDDSFEWEFEVYDQMQNLKLKKTNLTGKKVKFSTNGWKEGLYPIRVKYKDKVLTKNLIVKKTP